MSIKKIVKQIKGYSLQGLVRAALLKLKGKELIISGSCEGCGSCCNKINLQTEQGWVRNQKEFEDVCDRYPEYKRFSVIGKDDQGFLQFSCKWVTREGLCRDYDNRLSICRKFPDKSLHFCGGGLPWQCGYSIDAVVPFDKILQKEIGKSRNE